MSPFILAEEGDRLARFLIYGLYMDHYEFIDMDNRGKAFAVWHYGVFLAERRYKAYIIKLYAIDSFFVEVYYQRDEALIADINSFEELDFLDPYLNQITLGDLIKA